MIKYRYIALYFALSSDMVIAVVCLFVFCGVIAMLRPWYAVQKPSEKTILSWSIDRLVFWLTIHSREWEFLYDEKIVASEENLEFLRDCVRTHIAG
jgi:hypothetical protein